MFLIIGTANVDLIVSGFERMPVVMGDEFTTSSLVFCDEPLGLVLGGNGANCAYVLAGLGVSTALCSAVGQDQLGQIVRGWLAARGVNLAGFVHHPQRATAYTTIVSDRVLNRLAFHHPGALAAYTQADVPVDLLASSEVVLATSYTIMPQLRPAGFTQILAAARQRGAITALDIGPAIGHPAVTEELAPLLPHTDYLLANQHELTVCTGEPALAPGVEQLLRAGAHTVIIKQGAAGATIYTTAGERPVPAFAVDARSTVGAGDSFNAGLLYGVQQRWSVDRAVRLGNAVAALVISKERGILDAPTLAQARTLMDAV
jgi:sugar/nucleoside kinase (ribokinase family)